MSTTTNYTEWEPYKAQIEQIYLHEGKTQKELSRIIEKTHGFRKTKHQYEKAFERWGFKKYQMTSEKWKFVKYRKEKRKRENGKESEVYIDGILCPSKKVKYEIGRQAFESTIARFTSAPSPKTPEGVMVCSPGPATTWQLQWPPNLPWFAFSQTPVSQNLPGNLLSAISSTSQALQTTGFSRSQLKRSLTQSLDSLLSWKPIRCVKLLWSSSRVAAVLNATMPEEYDDQHRIVSERIYSNGELYLEEFLRIALFLLSNNRILGHAAHDPTTTSENDENGEKKDKLIINLLRISGSLNISNMRNLVSLKIATADAIAEKLFGSAVRSCDFQAIELMLEVGMSPDISIMSGEGKSSSPLVHAARISDNELSFKICRLLLLHKADLNQNNAGKSALEWAIKFNNEELVRILISKGMKIPLSALGKAFNCRCSKNIVEMIMDADADIKERLDRGNLMTVLGYIVNKKNAELAKLLLSRGANPDSLHSVGLYYPSSLPRTSSWSKCGLRKSLKAYQTTTLGVAASKGDTPMMHILLAAHATVNRTNNSGNYIHPLALAVIKREEEATRILLEAGADIQAAEIYEVSDGERKRSLFERALEANDLPICQLLLANGAEAGAQLMQDYYSSQLWEHVKQDDTETVALLLQSGARANDLRKGIPNSALGLAITRRNWTMFSLLQSAGVTGESHAIPSIDSVETARFLEKSNLLPQLLRTNGQMILIKAILAENEPLTSLLLSHGADLQERNIENAHGKSKMMVNTPLEAALCLGNLSLAQIILSRGGWVTEAELNAIMWRAGMVQDHSVLLSFINMFGRFSLSSPTAIAMAVLSNDEAAIHHLLAAGVDPRGAPKLYIDGPREILEPKPANHTYTDEMMGCWNFDRVKQTCGLLESVLELAVIHGNRQILQTLLGATIWTREEKGRALSLSLHFWDRQFVQDLLDVDADIHQEVLLIYHVMGRPLTPVKVALSEGNTLLLRTLLAIDRIVDHTNSRVYMQYAIEHGNIEQFKILLTANTAVNGLLQNSEGQSLLETAVRAGKNKIVSLLLEAGVDINETHEMSLPGGTALHLAGEMGNMELMKILLEAGARIHAVPTPKHEKTTLWYAIEGGDLEVVNKVLAAGAVVNGPPVGKGGMTPLQQAAKQGNMELVDLFLKAGANVNQEPASHSGATALQFAAIQGYFGIARKLLDAGASVQAPGAERYGRTALEGTAEHGRLDMLQLLLNEGVLIEGNDRIEYIRAIKLAQQNSHHAVAKFLKSFSDWAEVDCACYEEQTFDREGNPMFIRLVG